MTYLVLPPPGSVSWRDAVASFAALPAAGGSVGEARIATDTGTVYWWTGSAWSATSAGTLSSIAAITAVTDGSAAGAGVIGQILTAQQAADTSTGVGSTGAWGNVVSLSITAGRWLAWGTVGFSPNSATLTTSLACAVSASSSGVGINELYTTEAAFLNSGGTASSILSCPCLPVNISSTTTYYLNTRFYYSAGSPQHRGRINALRIG